jgi:hypothetical protein
MADIYWAHTLSLGVHWQYTLYDRYILAVLTVTNCILAVHTVWSIYTGRTNCMAAIYWPYTM